MQNTIYMSIYKSLCSIFVDMNVVEIIFSLPTN